jgi:hypothetical protein
MPSTRRRALSSSEAREAMRRAYDARTYGLTALMCAGGANLVTGRAAVGLCVGIAGLFAATALAACFWRRGYDRLRFLSAPFLCAIVPPLHSLSFHWSQGPRNALPERVGFREFWVSRFGPLITGFVTLSLYQPRGRPLAATLGAQVVGAAASSALGCTASIRLYPPLAFFYNRLVDVWDEAALATAEAILGGGLSSLRGCDGGVCTLPASPAAPPAALAVPALAACTQRACESVSFMLYLAVACVAWAAAPPARTPALQARQGRRQGVLLDVAASGAALAVVVAALAWVGLGMVWPRPEECVRVAAAAGSVHLRK